MITHAVIDASRTEVVRRRVAGVPLVKRAIIVASRAGVAQVVVVAEAALARELEGDPELAALTASIDYATVAPSLDEPHVTLRADTVFDIGAVKAALASDGPARITVRGAPTTIAVVGESAPTTIEVAEGLFHDAATPALLARAEDALFGSLGKRTDGPVSRLLNRHVSTFVTRRLVNTNVTPNQMTIVANVIGALGVILVFQGTWGLVALGAFLVQMQSILDGCDGELARLKFKSSKLGEWLDNVLDDQVNVGYGVALGFAGTAMTGQWWWTWVGVAAGAAFTIHNLIFYYQLAFVHRSGNPFHFRWWFEKPGVDVTAMLDKQGFVAGAGYLVRALIRRDVFLFGFMVLAFVGLPHVAAAWYAAIAASQFGLMMLHVLNGGAPAASRAPRR